MGLIAERWFGYVSDWRDPSPARQLSNARALGNGLLVSHQLFPADLVLSSAESLRVTSESGQRDDQGQLLGVVG